MKRKGKPYSTKEEQYILDNYNNLEHEEIAKNIGRTTTSIRQKYRQLRERQRRELIKLYGREHLSTHDVMEFKLLEGKKYLIKNTVTNRENKTDGYLTNKRAKARVVKNYENYIAFERNGRIECIQKIDLISGNVKYKEV